MSQAQLIVIPTANGYPLGINVLSTLVVPTRALENSAFVAYVNYVQTGPGWPEYLTFYGQTTVADFGGNTLFVGSSTHSELQHVFLNTTGQPSASTAIDRPAPDVQGLCGNVTLN